MDRQHDLFLRWLTDSKDALNKLKANVQRVRWQQEACCDLYGAASQIVMSLEQAVFLRLLDDHRSASLPEIFAATASNIELAQLLVEGHAQVSICTRLSQSSKGAASKLSEVSQRLRHLAQQVQALQASDHNRSAAHEQSHPLPDVHKGARTHLQPHTLHGQTLICCLHQGCQCHHVDCLLSIVPGEEQHSPDGSGQVWWTLAAGQTSRLYTHDLGTAITTELSDVGTNATILSLSADGAGRVWMGHQNGLVQAWCANFQSPICQLTKLAAADVRCMTRASDDKCMWLGLADGLVHLAKLIVRNQTPGEQPIPAVLMTLDPANCLRASALSAIMPAATPAMTPRQQRPGLSTIVSGDLSDARSSTASLQTSQAKSHAIETNPMLALPAPASKPGSQPHPNSAEKQIGTTGEHAIAKQSQPRKQRSESNTASSRQSPDSIPVFTGLSKLRAQAQTSNDSSPHSKYPQRSMSPRDQLSHVGKPALDILVATDRVVIRGGVGDKAVLREWTPSGHFIKSHILQLGPVTSMMMLPSTVQLPHQINQQPSTTSWQLLTGHSSGDAQVWAALQNQPMLPLAVLKAAIPSPVRSLLLIEEHQLLCCAHADGFLVFYGISSSSNAAALGQDPEKQGLPSLSLQHAVHQAHRTGLEQCAMASSGLLTLGCSGTILMWSKQQIAYFAEQVFGQQRRRDDTSSISPPLLDRDSAQVPDMPMDRRDMAQAPAVPATNAPATQTATNASGSSRQTFHTEARQKPSAAQASAADPDGGDDDDDDDDGARAYARKPGTTPQTNAHTAPAPAALASKSSKRSHDGHQVDRSRRSASEYLMRRFLGADSVAAMRKALGRFADQPEDSESNTAHAQDAQQQRQLPAENIAGQQPAQPGKIMSLTAHLKALNPSRSIEHKRRLRRSQSHSELSAAKSSLDAAVDAAIDAAMKTNRSSEPLNPAMDMHAHLTLPNDETRTSLPSDHKLKTHSSHRASILPIGSQINSQQQLGLSASLKNFSKSGATDAPERSKPALLPPQAPPVTKQTDESTPASVTRSRCQSLEETEVGQDSDAAPLSKRGRTLPNQQIKRSDMFALRQPPDRLASQLSTLQTLQKVGSLSRRASLANKLLQMSLAGAPTASFTESEFGSRSSSSTTKAPLKTAPQSFTASTSVAPAVPSLNSAKLIAASIVRPESQPDTLAAAHSMPAVPAGGTQRLSSEEINRKAAEVRLQRLLSGANIDHPSKKTPSPWPSKASRLTLASDSLHDSGDTLQTADDASQAGQRRTLQRTLSDVALQALEAVENMKCNIIPYRDLQIKRKIGDGSIGQVYLGRWLETDVAIKVIAQMQNLSTMQGLHPQDPGTMQAPNTAQDRNITLDDGSLSSDLTVPQRNSLAESQISDKDLTAITTLEREVSIMGAVRHPNITLFMGLCLNPVCIVTEFCARGSLSDVLRKAATNTGFAQQMDWVKRLTMAMDAAKGMLQLHNHKPPILHRDLKSPNLLVDKHWKLKVTDFNLSSMMSGCEDFGNHSSVANNPRWLAPEAVTHEQFSKAADVYSFGIIMWELMTWQVPWEELNPFQIMVQLTQKQGRPEIPPLYELPGQPLPGIEGYMHLMRACWQEDPDERPSFDQVIAALRRLLQRHVASRQSSQQMPELTTQESADSIPNSPRQHAPQTFNPKSGSHCSNPQRSPLADVPEHPTSPSPEPSSSSLAELKPGQNQAAWDVHEAMQETAHESNQQAAEPPQAAETEAQQLKEEPEQSRPLPISSPMRTVRRSFSENSRPRLGRMQSPFASFAKVPITPDTSSEASLDLPRDAPDEKGHHRPTKSAGGGTLRFDVPDDAHLDGQHEESMQSMDSGSSNGKAEAQPISGQSKSRPVQTASQNSPQYPQPQHGLKQALASSLYRAASQAFSTSAAQSSKLESQESRSFTDGNPPAIKSSRHFDRSHTFQLSLPKSPEQRRKSDELVRGPHRLQFASGLQDD